MCFYMCNSVSEKQWYTCQDGFWHSTWARCAPSHSVHRQGTQSQVVCMQFQLYFTAEFHLLVIKIIKELRTPIYFSFHESFGWNSDRFRIPEGKDKKPKQRTEEKRNPMIPWYRMCTLPLKCYCNKLPMKL